MREFTWWGKKKKAQKKHHGWDLNPRSPVPSVPSIRLWRFSSSLVELISSYNSEDYVHFRFLLLTRLHDSSRDLVCFSYDLVFSFGLLKSAVILRAEREVLADLKTPHNSH